MQSILSKANAIWLLHTGLQWWGHFRTTAQRAQWLAAGGGLQGRSEHFPTYFQVSENTMRQAAGWAVFVLDPCSEIGPHWTQWHPTDCREHGPVTQVCKSSQQKQLTAVAGNTESQRWRTHNQVKAFTPLTPLQKTLHYASPSKQFPLKGERHLDRNQKSKWKAICEALAWHAGVPRPCTGEKSSNFGVLAVSFPSERQSKYTGPPSWFPFLFWAFASLSSSSSHWAGENWASVLDPALSPSSLLVEAIPVLTQLEPSAKEGRHLTVCVFAKHFVDDLSFLPQSSSEARVGYCTLTFS